MKCRDAHERIQAHFQLWTAITRNGFLLMYVFLKLFIEDIITFQFMKRDEILRKYYDRVGKCCTVYALCSIF